MMDERGRLECSDLSNPEFHKRLEKMLNTLPEKQVPYVKVGDTFKIRDCRFEVTEISEDGIKAKGLSRGEYIDKTFKI